MRKCCECGNEIPPKRLEILPDAKTCVNCSTTDKKVGVPVTFGNGDHTYTELNIMSASEHERFEKLKRRYNE